MYTKKNGAAWQRYRAKACDRLAIDVPRGTKDRYKSHAARVGKPLRRLIMDLIDTDIARVDAETGQPLDTREPPESR